jgi:regulator of sirC expression with transglutaminase-like and TPR domain
MSQSPVKEITEADVAPVDFLRRLGQSGDGPHDIALAGLMLAALDHPDKTLASYRAHLAELAEAAKTEAGFARDAETGARALGSVMTGRYGYDGERMRFDEPENADLISVIERRRGLPVALGILYIHAGRAAGMDARGLFAPGHFLLKLVLKGSEALIDPFNGCVAFDRERLSASQRGSGDRFGQAAASDEPNPFEPVSDTDVLLRLENNVRSRALKARNAAHAIEVGLRMALIAPKRPALWLELGRMQEAAGSLSAALASYETGLKTSPAGDPFHNEASLALQALKRRLN